MFGGAYFGKRFLGNAYWGEGGGLPPAPTADRGGAGNINWLRKKKPTVIRYSDFTSQEAYAAALAAAAIPLAQVSDTGYVEPDDDFDDDDAILFAIVRILQ